jgi:hypothetical protein
MTRDQDRAIFTSLPKEKQLDYLFIQLRNLWAVDGLYFLGIEEQYGTEAATQIDANVWKTMGKIEARKLKDLLQPKAMDLPTAIHLLELTSWALDLEDKEIEIHKDRAVIRNRHCRVQTTRLSKGFAEFGCKHVRLGFLQAFIHELNPNIQVTCHHCPPDTHPTDNWCEWEITLKETAP